MPSFRIRAFRTLAVGLLSCISQLGNLSACHAADIPFVDVELPTKLGVGYAVQLLDMNDDKRLDICVVDQERILWLENPTWKEHILIEKQTKKDNVCFSSWDINGDGQRDFAVGADWRPFDTQTGGTIQWITGAGSESASSPELVRSPGDRETRGCRVYCGPSGSVPGVSL